MEHGQPKGRRRSPVVCARPGALLCAPYARPHLPRRAGHGAVGARFRPRLGVLGVQDHHVERSCTQRREASPPARYCRRLDRRAAHVPLELPCRHRPHPMSRSPRRARSTCLTNSTAASAKHMVSPAPRPSTCDASTRTWPGPPPPPHRVVPEPDHPVLPRRGAPPDGLGRPNVLPQARARAFLVKDASSRDITVEERHDATLSTGRGGRRDSNSHLFASAKGITRVASEVDGHRYSVRRFHRR